MRRSLMSGALALAFSAAFAACAPSGDDAPEVDVDLGEPEPVVVGADSMMESRDGSAQSADQEFLREMSDHHEGLIQIAEPVIIDGTSGAASDARRLQDKQLSERDQMVAMMEESHGRHEPSVMVKHMAQADSVASLLGAERDRLFYRMVVEHHREGIRMIDQFMPRLTDTEVRAMAEKMKADQQREIEEFERKSGSR